MLLAKEFGELDYEAMLLKIPRRIYLDWLAYYMIQPFGDQRGDMQAAVVARAFAGGELTDHMPLLED